MPQWTPSQRLAIETTGCDLLVSASAGTGKTAVLVERIARLALDRAAPVDIDRFLVVTFTRAAAAEMREKIAAALRAQLASNPRDERLRRQVLLLDRAQISTIHSFCETLLRGHFHRVGIDPEFSVLDAQEAALLETEIAQRLFESEFERRDPVFLEWLDSFQGANPETPARRALLRVHRFLQSVKDPGAWETSVRNAYPLDDPGRGRRMPFEDHVWFAAWREAFLKELDYCARELDACRRAALSVEPRYVSWIENVSDAAESARAKAAARDWDGAIRAIRDYRPPNKARILGEKTLACALLKERLDKLHKEILEENLQGDLAAATPGEAARAHAAAAPAAHLLLDLAHRFQERYTEAKRARAALDFADLERVSLHLLREPGGGPSDAARVCRERYEHVLVDEYQDINPVQDAILRLVSRGGDSGRANNLFAVGDVKQSIYAFRLAAPEIFLEKYNRFPPVGQASRLSSCELPTPASADKVGQASRLSSSPVPTCARVDLRENFRSRSGVLLGVNEVFRQIMNRESCAIDYGPEAELVAGAAYPSVEGAPNGVRSGAPTGGAEQIPVEVHLLEVEIADQSDRSDPSDPLDPSEAPDPSASDWQAIEREALWIGRRIRKMVGDPARGIAPEFGVLDPSRGAADKSGAPRLRPVEYRDVAILMRSVKGRVETVASVLGDMGIPVYAELETGFFAAAEVRDVLNLLRAIDNLLQDIPLAAVLRSPFEGWSDSDLLGLRSLHPDGPFHDALRFAALQSTRSTLSTSSTPAADVAGRAARFIERLDRWRTRARRGELADLVASIYDETGYPACVLATAGGDARYANLMRLHRIAGRFDRFLRQGLGRFLRFVEQLREEEHDYGETSPAAEGQNAVRIMTIHKSKGLEFPVVFLADASRRFNLRDARDSIVLDREGGLGVSVADAARWVHYPSPALRLLRRRAAQRSLAEEMRILYVAMTRARERLVVSASVKKMEDRLRDWLEADPSDARRILSAPNPIEWLGPVLARHNDSRRVMIEAIGASDVAHGTDRTNGTDRSDPTDSSNPSSGAWPFDLAVHRASEIARWGAPCGAQGEAATPGLAKSEESDRSVQSVLSVQSEKRVAAALARIEWDYPHRALATCPARIAASEAKRRLGGDPGGEEGERVLDVCRVWDLDDKSAESDTSHRAGGPDAPDKAETSSARARGALAHLVLQHLDLRGELDYAGISAQIDRMIERELLDEASRQTIDIAALAGFFASPLGKRVLDAGPGRVWREVPFILGLAPSELGFADLAQYDDHERIRAQGVIDCLVEEPDGLVLIDYKTDRVRPEGVSERARLYAPQMRLYARAVDAIFGAPLKEAHLYFLAAGVAVRIQ